MKTFTLKLRQATLRDSDAILRWRNDPKTYPYCFDDRPVSVQQHAQWFSSRLKDPRTRIFIAHVNRRRVGQVRLDYWDPKTAEVSLSIAPLTRGRGLGLAALAAIMRQARRLGLRKLIARVQSNNIVSVALFVKAGYRFIARERIKGYDAYRMESVIGESRHEKR